MRQSSKAILAGTAGIVAYEAWCDRGEMISERFDEWLEHPIKGTVAVLGTLAIAGHLINIMPEGIDVIHQLGRLKHD